MSFYLSRRRGTHSQINILFHSSRSKKQVQISQEISIWLIFWKKLKFTCLEWLTKHLNYPSLLKKILKFTCLEWLKIYLNYPSWLEKILKFSYLKWLKMHHGWEMFEIYLPLTAKMHLNSPPWLEKNWNFLTLNG